MAFKRFGGGGGRGRNAITLICRGKHVRNRYLTDLAHTGATTKIADPVTCILTLIRTSFNMYMYVNRQIVFARPFFIIILLANNIA